MSTPLSIGSVDDVTSKRQLADESRHHKYATIEKCKSFSHFNANQPKVNFDWYKQLRQNARVLMKSKSDASRHTRTMQHASKSVNRDGTIASNHFRGVPADFVDKQAKHFLVSMTVSIRLK